MTIKQGIDVLQHLATTFALGYLMMMNDGVAMKTALITAGILTLRDLKSLFDDMMVKDGIKPPDDNTMMSRMADYINKNKPTGKGG